MKHKEKNDENGRHKGEGEYSGKVGMENNNHYGIEWRVMEKGGARKKVKR